MPGFLGIVGGMGAFAGARLLDYAFHRAVGKGAMQDHDFPKVVYYNYPVSGLGITGVANQRSLVRDVRVALSQLETIGCQNAIIACASAHEFYAKFQGGTSMRLLNIVELGCHKAAELGKVGVLCSESSRASGMFTAQLARFNAECFYPRAEDQTAINRVIEAAMLGRQGRPEAYALQTAVMNLHAAGATVVLLGCTELPLAVDPSLTSMRMIDAGKVAVDEALGYG